MSITLAGKVDTLTQLREALQAAQFNLTLADVDAARTWRSSAINQITDYLLPRLTHLEAPLLVVVGGPTGAGKSTLVNSLIGEVVSAASAIRPTTRHPVLVTSEADLAWFEGSDVLPDLRRTHGRTDSSSAHGSLGLVTSPAVPRHMGFLDAPDIDSISKENRLLARQLLEAADLWLFVTSANRYADAAGWELLDRAASRGITVGVVLNRTNAATADEIEMDLRRLLDTRGLDHAPIFQIRESTLDDGHMLPREAVLPVRDWLTQIAGNHQQRQQIIRQALAGALVQLEETTRSLAKARGEQEAAADSFTETVTGEFAQATANVMQATTDGSLLRGEVLARWQDVIGTSDVFRSFETWFAGTRDRVANWFSGTPSPTLETKEEITSGLSAVIEDEAGKAFAQTWTELRRSVAGRTLFNDDRLSAAPGDTGQRAIQLVQEWQGELLDLVWAETPEKRQRARIMSIGLNTVTVGLMVLIFASTGGLLMGEVAVAGGSAVLSQKLLETIFGDQAVRNLSKKGAGLLEEKVAVFFEELSQPYHALITPAKAGTSAKELSEMADILGRELS